MRAEKSPKGLSEQDQSQDEMHEMAKSGTNILDAGIDESEMTPIPKEITIE